MNNIKIYRERMAKTMTRDEKLFFMDKIDLHTYDVIIDFGGADGTLIYEIQRQYPDLDCQFIIVDNNAEMHNEYNLKNCTRVMDINGIDELLLADKEVLLICSSVLHEVNEDTVNLLAGFCQKWVKALVLRDMAYVNMRDTDYYGAGKTYEQIYCNPDLAPRFADFIKHSRELGWEQDSCRQIAHFILKYEYVENWDTEVKENYFNNNIIKLRDKLRDLGWLSTYHLAYPLPYKKAQAQTLFTFNLPNTHFKAILERASERR